MRILVTGGAGYIGSHISRALQQSGHTVYVLDDYSSGHPEVVVGVPIVADVRDAEAMDMVFAQHPIDVVIHCAALTLVGDSMRNPGSFYQHNVSSSAVVLSSMQRAGISSIVFSSSCSVYGAPAELPVTEETPLHPESVYAETKMIVERMIVWYAQIFGMRYVTLRYFNACGAAQDSSTGEWHEPETHLIPNVIRAGLDNTSVQLFGDDYDTPDGTCIRDYVHVEDLARAHVLAAEHLAAGKESLTLNLGSGKGYSNTEIVRAVAQALNTTISIERAARRPGDPARIEASYEKTLRVLGWKPEHTLESIITSSIAWEKHRRAKKFQD